MFDIPVEDLVFVVCTLVGGGLLLVTVLVDDIIGAFIDFDIGGVSLMPLGLEAAISPQAMADLIAYLMTLK